MPSHAATRLRAHGSYGGWPRFQRLLARVVAVASRRGVTPEAVAVRWALDKGAAPIVDVELAGDARAAAAALLGALGRPGGGAPAAGPLPRAPAHADAALWGDASFLSEEDHTELAAGG